MAGDYDSTGVGKRMGNGFIHVILRQGWVHTSKGATRFIGNVIEQARQLAFVTDFRMDAGYSVGSVMDALTDKNLKFTGQLKTNTKLDELAAPHLIRPADRPPTEGCEFCVELGVYQADSWNHPQRLILVVADQPDPAICLLNFIPRHFFLITNWNAFDRSSEVLVTHY